MFWRSFQLRQIQLLAEPNRGGTRDPSQTVDAKSQNWQVWIALYGQTKQVRQTAICFSRQTVRFNMQNASRLPGMAIVLVPGASIRSCIGLKRRIICAATCHPFRFPPWFGLRQRLGGQLLFCLLGFRGSGRFLACQVCSLSLLALAFQAQFNEVLAKLALFHDSSLQREDHSPPVAVPADA